MHHLETDGARAHFAETPDARAAHECLLLRTREMEKPQRDRPAAIRESAKQRAPSPYGYLAELDHALH
jgi:hypothetical protein